jgi:hypothetical protein
MGRAGAPGCGARGELGRALLESGITILCDVRRNPIRRKYGFSKNTLARTGENVGIRYEHLPELGIASEQRQGLDTQADYDALFDDYERTWLPKQGAALEKIRAWVDADLRPETYRPVDQHELVPVGEMGTDHNWRERREILLKKARVYDNLEELIAGAKANQVSLAVFKPARILDFVVEEDERETASATGTTGAAERRRGGVAARRGCSARRRWRRRAGRPGRAAGGEAQGRRPRGVRHGMGGAGAGGAPRAAAPRSASGGGRSGGQEHSNPGPCPELHGLA